MHISTYFRRSHWLRSGLLLLALAYMPLFWLLTSHPVQVWDEARTGLNGLNILRNNEWLVMRDAAQQPDLWNCKPPLWPWLLALSFKLLGPTELGLRLPSALAGLATALVVYRAGRRWLGSWEGGLLAAIILLTSSGYVGYHVTRSGDFDALLTLWTTLGTLNWLRYLTEGRNREAWLAGLFFFLAAFTKGVAGLLFGPGLLVATLALGQGQRLRRPAPWLAILLLLAGMGTWYGVREFAEPGYWQAVWQYELGGPAGSQLEGHFTEPYYYLGILIESKFVFWLVPALLGGLVGWNMPAGSRGWALARLAVCVAGTFMLVLAATQNRLPWYDAPMYPLLALLAALGLQQAGQAVASQQHWHLGPTTRLGGMLLLVCLPYWAQCRYLVRIYDARYQLATTRVGPHLHHQLREKPEIYDYYYANNSDNGDVQSFYLLATEMANGHYIQQVAPGEVPDADIGRMVVVCGARPRQLWESRYRTRLVLQTDSCVTLQLEGRR
ncbi:ArnT family glycosyltransferase [Hymenobacter negativus]|uniref:Glycosyltransferase family 39 protein n=1 Tax=Hymenobacter negativus TaxID=2795026 RepID=A0ABS3QGT4_9BACT|nr:glycosyltransferase family 39 protein [Hymenobacter negativus]MBO2010454.1 glycosyltransferase family 39 protein [Hymenobacter negativus]